MKRKMKWSVGIISFICIVLLDFSSMYRWIKLSYCKKEKHTTQQTSQSQYWGLLFAVGVYENAPDQDRPEMLQACDDLYNTLLGSPQYWQASNIHVQKGSQATFRTSSMNCSG